MGAHTHTHATRQLGPLHRGPGYDARRVFLFCPDDDLRQPIPAAGIVAIGTAVANNNRCAVPQQSPWPAGTFSRDFMFWKNRGGGLTGQPVGPPVGTATMTAVMSANRVDLGSFSSRCCTFRRTHTSADPIRLLSIRLALPLTCPHD